MRTASRLTMAVLGLAMLAGCARKQMPPPDLVAVGADSVHLWECHPGAKESSYVCTRAVELKGAFAVAASRRGIYVCTDHTVVKFDRKLDVVDRRDFDSSWVTAVACTDSVVCAFVDGTLKLLGPDLRFLSEVEVVPRGDGGWHTHPLYLAPDMIINGDMCFIILNAIGAKVDIRDPMKPRRVPGGDDGSIPDALDAAAHPPITHWVEPYNRWWAVVHYMAGGWGEPRQVVKFLDVLDYSDHRYPPYEKLPRGFKPGPDDRVPVRAMRRLMKGSGPPDEVAFAGSVPTKRNLGTRWVLATTAVDPPWAIVMRRPPEEAEGDASLLLVRLQVSGDSLLMKRVVGLPGHWEAPMFRYLIAWGGFAHRAWGDQMTREWRPRCRLRQHGPYLAALAPNFYERLARVTIVDTRRRPPVTSHITAPRSAKECGGVLSMFDIAFVPE